MIPLDLTGQNSSGLQRLDRLCQISARTSLGLMVTKYSLMSRMYIFQVSVSYMMVYQGV